VVVIWNCTRWVGVSALNCCVGSGVGEVDVVLPFVFDADGTSTSDSFSFSTGLAGCEQEDRKKRMQSMSKNLLVFIRNPPLEMNLIFIIDNMDWITNAFV